MFEANIGRWTGAFTCRYLGGLTAEILSETMAGIVERALEVEFQCCYCDARPPGGNIEGSLAHCRFRLRGVVLPQHSLDHIKLARRIMNRVLRFPLSRRHF